MTSRKCTRIGAKWSLPRYKRDWQNICAMLPTYLDDGTNGTVVYYLDGTTEEVSARLQWVLDDLLRYMHSSIEVITSQSRLRLGKNARRVPLIVTPDFCLSPIKARIPISRSDVGTGYLVLTHVQDVIPYGKENHVYFTGGKYITVLDTTRTVWENLNLTKEMREDDIWQLTQSQLVGA